ncbi:MAG: hypothetical protein MJZ26_10090 [Fibrobacter sp.]|nr:hypothetical protein [Fibrobacter sp.]
MNKSIKISAFIAGFALVAALTGCEDIRVEKYPSGQIRSEATYVKDKKQGSEKEYYENGNMKRESTYENDRRQGISKEYYDDGSIKAEYTYEDGYIEGPVTFYHKNGKVSSKLQYKQNKQIAFGEYFNENGEPETSGSYKDPRDGFSYEWIRIGAQLWIAENMNYATASGSVCAQCNHWGRLYDFENAKKACLEGFHMPTKHDWEVLLTYASVDSKPGIALKAGYGWDPLKGTGIFGNGKDELGFGAKAGGGHFAKSDVPLKERKFEGAGQKAYFWVDNGEVLVFYHDKDIAKFEKFNPQHGASLRCIKD